MCTRAWVCGWVGRKTWMERKQHKAQGKWRGRNEQHHRQGWIEGEGRGTPNEEEEKMVVDQPTEHRQESIVHTVSDTVMESCAPLMQLMVTLVVRIWPLEYWSPPVMSLCCRGQWMMWRVHREESGGKKRGEKRKEHGRQTDTLVSVWPVMEVSWRPSTVLWVHVWWRSRRSVEKCRRGEGKREMRRERGR